MILALLHRLTVGLRAAAADVQALARAAETSLAALSGPAGPPPSETEAAPIAPSRLEPAPAAVHPRPPPPIGSPLPAAGCSGQHGLTAETIIAAAVRVLQDGRSWLMTADLGERIAEHHRLPEIGRASFIAAVARVLSREVRRPSARLVQLPRSGNSQGVYGLPGWRPPETAARARGTAFGVRQQEGSAEDAATGTRPPKRR